MRLRNTNVKIKEEMFAEFCEQIRKQFRYAGTKKYQAVNSLYPDKEATDYVVDCYPEFIEGTILKYLLRFKNQKREEDVFKIATYCYILWLKYFTGDVREENLKIAEESRQTKEPGQESSSPTGQGKIVMKPQRRP